MRTVRGVSGVATRGEVQEMYDAVFKGKPVFHSGRWGMATAEAIFGMVESSRLGKEIALTHQVPVHPGVRRGPDGGASLARQIPATLS